MDLYKIIRELVEERNRVSRIIASLDEMTKGGKKSASQTGHSRRGRKSMDASARQEVSERMKRYWAKRRADQG